jgi:selenide, water dikinase
VLRRLTPVTHPDLLVGAATGDDAAVWRWADDRALVLTTDFITPLVDDARTWGRIAAVNAASDVYAMGGRPLLALNLVGWNAQELSTDLLVEVLDGAQEAGAEGGWVTVGGHTVDDPEPKFGLVVLGEVHPDRLLTNAGLEVGQALVLTKALGVGVIATALKRGQADAAVVDAAVASMVRLNAAASQAVLAVGATGATDVTGFGLLGHLGRMVQESHVDVELLAERVPLLPGARALAEAGLVPGGTQRNLEWVRDRLDTGAIDEVVVTLLADAQTSGGLVAGVDADAAEQVVAGLRAEGHDAAVIGRVTAEGPGAIRLR